MIGVFDSGSGGLTVLGSLRKALPEHKFVYLGDHVHAPYGARDAEEIYQLSCRNVDYLMRRGCRLVILACNTASVTMLRRIQQEWLPGNHPGCRVIGVFVPMVEYLTGRDWLDKGPSGATEVCNVALFATPVTVRSGMFSRELRKRASNLRILEEACPALVEAIESRACDEVIDALVETYVQRLCRQFEGEGRSHIVLGCTHYPLVADSFRRVLPEGCDLVSQPDVVADSLVAYLKRHRDLIANDGGTGGVDYITTGNPDRVRAAAHHFLGQVLPFRPINSKTVGF